MRRRYSRFNIFAGDAIGYAKLFSCAHDAFSGIQ